MHLFLEFWVASEQFGPFATLFQKEDREGGYGPLLQLGAHIDLSFDQVVTATCSGDPTPWICAMLSDRNWRAHLVAAVAVLFAESVDLEAVGFWKRLGHSMVTPQMVATAYFVDGNVEERTKAVVRRDGSVDPTTGRFILPASTFAAFVTLGGRLPSLGAWLQDNCNAPAGVLEESEVKDYLRITAHWLERMEVALVTRGRRISAVPCR